VQYEVHVIETEARPTAVIRHTVLRSEVRQNLLAPSIDEVLSVIAAQGLQTAGPIFSRHLTIDPYFFDFEIGVPVAPGLRPSGRVVASVLPAGRVARCLHHGPYEGLGPAWTRLRDEIARTGLSPAQELWESYLSGPADGPAESWFTELNQPLLATARRPGGARPDAIFPEVMPALAIGLMPRTARAPRAVTPPLRATSPERA